MRSTLLTTALAAVLCLSSCSIGYNREWAKATREAAAHAPTDMTGPWIGTWRSEVNGHNGELRCIVSATAKDGAAKGSDSQPGQTHRFHYHATFMKILSATYDVNHQIHRTTDGYTFSGDQEIYGKGSGIYHYEGRATPQIFHATFRSEHDHGVFEMKRP